MDKNFERGCTNPIKNKRKQRHKTKQTTKTNIQIKKSKQQTTMLQEAVVRCILITRFARSFFTCLMITVFTTLQAEEHGSKLFFHLRMVKTSVVFILKSDICVCLWHFVTEISKRIGSQVAHPLLIF